MPDIQINIINCLEPDNEGSVSMMFSGDNIKSKMDIPLSGKVIEINSGLVKFKFDMAYIKITHCGIIS